LKKETANTIDNSVDDYEETLAQFKENSSIIQEYETELQMAADKVSLLCSTDDDLMKRYQDNLEVFKEYYPDIYDFYKKYEPNKYIIDTVDGFINALNVEDGNHFYDYPSYLTTKVQFDHFRKSPNIKKFNFRGNEGNEANFLHVNCLDKISALLPEKKEKLNKEVKNFSSLIIFGVAAGYHLELLAQHYDVPCVFIVEPDLDLFFISMFSINWRYVLNTFDKKGTRAFISLGEQKDTFFDDFITESAKSGRYQMSHIAGYIHHKSDEIANVLTEFNRRYFEVGQGWGFFDDAVMSIGHMLVNLKQKVPLLKKTAIVNNEQPEVPVFIVGNGPSLDGLITIIKAHQGKAIIISCGSALSALYEYGIKPDFHCEQERTFPVAEKIEHSCPKEFLDNIILLAPTIVHPAVFSLFGRSVMAAKKNEPSSTLLLKNDDGQPIFSSYHFINPTVANTALVMGYNLGFKNFYLFGIDLGHRKGGLHHSKKSLYYSNEQEDLDLYSMNEKNSSYVDGNFGGKFITDDFFYQSNANLSKQIRGFDDLHCYNLSDGSLIKGSTPTTKEYFVEMFHEKKNLDKAHLVDTTYEKSVYHDDDGKLAARVVDDLDFQYFEHVCKSLIDTLDQPLECFKDAVDLLFEHTIILKGSTQHINELLTGTVMHIQVTLTHLLYGEIDEKEGIAKFTKGLVFYRDFLKIAPDYYKEQAEEAHYLEDCEWIVKLRNKYK